MTFRGFIIDGIGTEAGVTSWALIGVFNVTNSLFENAEVRNARGMGILDGTASGGYYPGLVFRNMHVHHNGLSPLCLDGVSGPCHGLYLHSSGMTIEERSYHHNSEHGIVISFLIRH